MNIVLGVTGGIAAYKAAALVRLLVEEGHDVHVVPTEDALRFVGRPTWEALSRNPVTTSVHEDVPEVRHVALGQRADLVVVAPATANTIARMTAGIADDLLGTTLLATRAPVLVAPAMHTEMWQHPATQDNVAILRSRGVVVIGPESGRLTGADSGPGRMSEPDAIAERVREMLDAAGNAGRLDAAENDAAEDDAAEDDAAEDEARKAVAFGDVPRDAAAATERATGGDEPIAVPEPAEVVGDLAGRRILVSAGGTREPIDPVRYIGNRSSGRQGVAVAAAAAARGAKVVLLAANIDEAVLEAVEGNSSVRVVPVGSAAELEAAAHAGSPGADVVIMAAAVSDYRVSEVSDHKIRKEDSPGQAPTLTLVENPDILAALVRERREGQVLVGFAAETAESEDELLERGRRKLARKGVDLLAVNSVGWSEGFESHENTLHIIESSGMLVGTVSGSKRQAADGLLDAVVSELRDD
ncbi:bifunctional phosphopantothenoylcysteine decarboxylase/phosphopantothenate synthase [Leucobacter zeae]|nr:bifunctional phosphopantothenoylcysteine decarboxylase/phosphopantothenate synthase [Leucobacter zeae]